jgi:hypothetical protein
VTAVERLFGGTALAVGGGDGTVRVLFTARTPPVAGEVAAEDGLTTETARGFAAGRAAAPITALAASPRSRLFAAGDESGRIRLLHSTAGGEVGFTVRSSTPSCASFLSRVESTLADTPLRSDFSSLKVRAE